jgi:hypothetical protein
MMVVTSPKIVDGQQASNRQPIGGQKELHNELRWRRFDPAARHDIDDNELAMGGCATLS